MRVSSALQFPMPTQPELRRMAKLVGQSLLWGMLIGAAMALCVPAANAGLVYSTAGSTYSQNFNTLATTGAGLTWANDSTLASWSLFRQPAPGTAITTYSTGTGSSATGSFYSFGSASNTDRALGGVGANAAYFGTPGTANPVGWIAFSLTNGTGQSLTSLNVTYDGEQWRNGGNTAIQSMVMEYGFGANFGSVASWIAPGSAFDFASPIHTGTAGALNGNIAANRTPGLGGTIAATWNPSNNLWIRFAETNDPSNDHGLALDNFAFSATGVAAVPEPSTFLLGLVGLSVFGARQWHRRISVPQ